MPLVTGRASALPMRVDDGAVQRRRLLQDLERQWLEAWGQVGQSQLPLRSAVETVDEASPPRADAAVHQRPRSDANLSRPDWPVPARGSGDHRGAVEDQGPHDRRERRDAEPVTQHRDWASGDAARTVETDPVPGAPAGPASGAGAASSPPPVLAKPFASGNAAALGLQPADAGQAVFPPPDVGAAVRVAAGRIAAPELRRGSSVFAQTAVAERRPSLEIGPGPMPVAGAGDLLTSHGADQERTAPASQRRVAFALAETPDPGPRHLMLRELNEREVLASMRDAQLTSSESALAAQGLARALMQAGYARVQVFVNGRQHQHAADGDGAPDLKADSQQAADAPSLASNAQIRHGH